jgi:hypothetical protein
MTRMSREERKSVRGTHCENAESRQLANAGRVAAVQDIEQPDTHEEALAALLCRRAAGG